MFTQKEYERGSVEAIRAGILWREKLDYGRIISGFVSLWVVCQFILQIFDHPGWLIGFGCIYALFIAVRAGGNEVYDGAEEFSFSLAPPRSERFKTKFIYGLVPLVVMLLVSLVTIKFNLSQYFWRIFVETGLTEPYQGSNEVFFYYGIGLLIPLTLYITIFSSSIMSWGPGWLPGSVFKGIFVTGFAVIGIAILYNNMDYTAATVLSLLLLIIVSAYCLNRSYKIYFYKEGHSIPKESGSRNNASMIVLIVIVVIIFFLFFMWTSKPSVSEVSRPATMEYR